VVNEVSINEMGSQNFGGKGETVYVKEDLKND